MEVFTFQFRIYFMFFIQFNREGIEPPKKTTPIVF